MANEKKKKKKTRKELLNEIAYFHQEIAKCYQELGSIPPDDDPPNPPGGGEDDDD